LASQLLNFSPLTWPRNGSG